MNKNIFDFSQKDKCTPSHSSATIRSMALKRQARRQTVLEKDMTSRDADQIEISLRPAVLSEYIGQSKIKGHLLVHMEAARKRTEPLGHTLLHGPPGLGKTTLAHVIAHEMNAQVRTTSGPAIEKPGDLASLLTNLAAGDILFIDEIHRLRPVVEEVLYSAMEDFTLDLVIGKGPSARSMRIDLQPFTLVGATTKVASMSAPLRDRFLHTFKLAFYETEEMKRIVERSASILNMSFEENAANRIATCARATPRIANRLVRAVRDFAQVNNETDISVARVEKTLNDLGVDEDGLDDMDRTILSAIIEKFAGGPVGLSTLAAAVAEEQETIEDVYEPYLMQCGFLQRTAKGRMATKRAYELLGAMMPAEVQQMLV